MGYREKILYIINEPVFDAKLYNETMIQELVDEIKRIINKMKITKDDDKILIMKKIEIYLQENVTIRMKYFNFFDEKSGKITEEELKYRTAYSALVKKNTTCYGYCEAVRILLLIFDIKSKTLLAKLPREKYKMMHYTTAVETEGNYIIIDPERHSYCDYKNIDFLEYMRTVIYSIPNNCWCMNKLLNYGVGILAEDYLNDKVILDDINILVL